MVDGGLLDCFKRFANGGENSWLQTYGATLTCKLIKQRKALGSWLRFITPLGQPRLFVMRMRFV